jgi:hypothetical protein
MAPRMPSKSSFNKAPGYVKPASAAANKKAGVHPPPLKSKKTPLKKPAKVPIVGSGAGPKKPKSNVISPSSGSDSYVRVHAPSGGTVSGSSPSMPSMSGVPQDVMGMLSNAAGGGYEMIRNSPSTTTNGMTGVDEYKYKALKAFTGFNF